jgi:uncharacterized Tic20 family protein
MSTKQNHGDNERSVGGIVVHLLGLVFGVFGSAAVYLLASTEFSKSNARNSLNWQVLFLLALAVLLAAVFLVGSDIVTVVAGFGILALYAVDALFCLYAGYKATRGATWQYPFSPSFLGS